MGWKVCVIIGVDASDHHHHQRRNKRETQERLERLGRGAKCLGFARPHGVIMQYDVRGVGCVRRVNDFRA